MSVFVKLKLEAQSQANSAYTICLVSMQGFPMIYTPRAFIRAVQVMCRPPGSLRGAKAAAGDS